MQVSRSWVFDLDLLLIILVFVQPGFEDAC